ncbi:pimeloyl-ACP methyl ester esterase BioH [Shewanella waksmanii]|uniref:pimeloyl-ACP methyl ester esterase BioH n=1 Tax=Shewanella waksmanii TaxID=213783 RepID=UPI00048D1928|nr:pimeloyl-ACP methyl ester esterase BioH [Shewanella waksmanii]
MNSSLNIHTIGHGQPIVMLHGWGMNNAVFTPLHSQLQDYCVHYVDLPGFGHSPAIDGCFEQWVEHLVNHTPSGAIWAGWSLGGLLATQAAISHPQHISALATIASSPCFMAQESDNWPGIPAAILAQFGDQLGQDLPKTIERFLAIQAMGCATAKEDIKRLRDLVLAKPLPNQLALQQSLAMLQEIDLRSQLPQITQPWLRVWGRLDGLVPRRVPPRMPAHPHPHQDLMLAKASHAPFFSHTEEFSDGFMNWLSTLA